MSKLEDNDRVRFAKLKDYYTEHGVLPSYSTIQKLIGVLSKSAVFWFIDRMKKCNRIAMTPENKIKPGVEFNNEWNIE